MILVFGLMGVELSSGCTTEEGRSGGRSATEKNMIEIPCLIGIFNLILCLLFKKTECCGFELGERNETNPGGFRLELWRSCKYSE